ncbi:solute carrier family 26 member 10-like [Topomyia yanbarensis]|uniref:solute carrier family 26 member 10-like n=1 Tax=Topomyia yanbarensis TaxID=2498891 RepID=UPI00273C57F6|nr:solute carrier family 26 member 10-like [Topomyia yanbarensis]XP_058834300.1 solute carrier family 26 member 10-like [Topomyia yanbarensis]
MSRGNDESGGGGCDGTQKGITNRGFYQDLEDNGIKQSKPFSGLPQFTVARPHYQQDVLNSEMNYSVPQSRVCQDILKSVRGVNAKSCAKSIFPIFSWLAEYSCKRDFVADLISGCTVAVMHIPQGMGYALLANVPPIMGIYMAFFPVLVYFILGTSRHNSMGTFAVVSIMVGKSVLAHSSAGADTIGEVVGNATQAADGTDGSHITRSPMVVAATVCFAVGIIQLIMYVCRLGVISFLLSDTLVSGFTTGAAIHVLSSQIKDLLGLSLPPISGNFKIINTYIAIFSDITSANFAAILISTVTIVLLVINNEYLKPKVAKRSKIPIPIELMAVISGTLLSRYLALNHQYAIKTIGHIPTGFPEPALPDFDLLRSLLLDSFTIAMVAYAVSVSMGLIFAQKQNYEIDFNQELLAMGASNVFGSFFSCMPFSASLSRSMIQFTVGGKTQVASVVSCGILAVVLLWIGPFFEPLPRCVLAGIIVVSLKGLLMQVTQFVAFWRLSCVDAAVWMVTFLTVVLVAIDLGLLVGILLSVCCIFFRGMKPYTCLLQNVPQTDLYLDVNRYKGTVEIAGIKIFHYCGSLNFATRASFKTNLCQALNLNLTKEIKTINNSDYKRERSLRYLILDFIALSDIDPSAISSLKSLINEFEKLSIKVLVAGASCPVYEMMLKCKLVSMDEREYCKVFPTIHDAVLWAMDILAADSGRISIVETD